MKFKYLYLFLVCFLLGVSNIYASSIEYNLTIDENMNFKENNIYKINDNELVTNGTYDFLTSIFKDTIYFNDDTKVKYTKKKSHFNGVYTVVLSNEYSSMFLAGSRILEECFSKYDVGDTVIDFSIETSTPFYCYSRADTITINIKTNLNVVDHNAQTVNNNVYTWKPKDENFSMKFEIGLEQVGDTPMDDITEEDFDNSQDEEQDTTDEQTDSISISGIVIAVIFVILSIIGIIVVIVLKVKKSNLNKI